MEISAAAASALDSGSPSVANDPAARLGASVSAGGGPAAAGSVVSSPDSVVRPFTPDIRPSDEGAEQTAAQRSVSDVEFSGGSCTTFSSGGGDVAPGRAHGAAPPLISRGSIQSLAHSAQASANTTIRVGWKRREKPTQTQEVAVGRPRGPQAPDERAVVVDRVPTLEAAIRGFADRGTEVVVNPALGTIFDSLPEAYEFYNLYSWEVGFGIRYGKSKQNVNGTKCMQEIVCGCAGKPERENSTSMRTNCAAMLRLHRTDDGGWYVSEIRASHNHELLRTCMEKLHWPSHRRIDTYTRDLVKQLRQNNVNLGKVYNIIGSLFGRMENVPFTKRCLRTFCGKLSREQADDDVRKTMDAFSELGSNDPEFLYVVEVDKESKIKTLLWTNGRSKMQYRNFGDVVTFDTTYKTNLYDMPFGLFVGVNNHFQSIIMWGGGGGVMIWEETIESFNWVFTEFIRLMGGKPPKTILTDQARAMEVAILQTMPGTTHRWCKWHVLRKAKEHLGPHYTKRSDFRAALHKVVNEMLTVDEFEVAWAELLDRYKLHNNTFLIQIFEQYSKLQFDREAEEGFQEKRTRLGGVVLRYNFPLEEHASQVYTRTMFDMFGQALYRAGRYDIEEVQRGARYNVRHVEAEKREKWCREMHVVDVHDGGARYTCECGLFEHMGMLCCHAIKVLIHLGVRKIPSFHVLKRWTVDARDNLPLHLIHYQKDKGPPRLSSYRHTALHLTALEFVQLGDSNVDAFDRAMGILNAGKVELTVLAAVKDGKSLVDQTQVGESANPTMSQMANGSQQEDVCSQMFISTECGLSSVSVVADLRCPLSTLLAPDRKR